jgi:UDP-glucose:(heptosyl)LPS alpha-1,3-glucosyltransferase
LKIALVRKNYTHYGGAENYLKLMAQELTAKGHDVTIFSSSEWPPGPYTVRKIKSRNKPSWLSNIHFALESRTALEKESFDSILSFERTLYQDIYRAGDGCHKEWLNKRGETESLFKKTSFKINPLHIMQLFLEKQCFLNSKNILANSMMVKRDIMNHYPIADKKIQVIYNGVDLQRFQPPESGKKVIQRKNLDLDGDRIILFVGSDFRRKGVGVLLKAFSLMNRDGIKLLIAGGRTKERYKSMAKNLGIDNNVVFWGAEQKVEKLYAIADIFVLPTMYDPFSNATIEAMASGIPAITTAYNGASEIIEDSVNGFVVADPSDVHGFAEKMIFALENAESMGKQARSTAESCSIQEAVDKVIKIISEKNN